MESNYSDYSAFLIYMCPIFIEGFRVQPLKLSPALWLEIPFEAEYSVACDFFHLSAAYSIVIMCPTHASLWTLRISRVVITN